MNAADKDALIAAAAEAGITITRTSKDFFLGEGHNRERVTPGQIRALIAEAQTEQQARAEALEAAAEIREQEAEQTEPEVAPVVEMAAEAAPEPEQVPDVEVAAEAPQDAQDAAPEVSPAPEAQPETPAPAAAPAKAKRTPVLYGPPCGGQIAHLAVATSEHARNPIVHLGELTAPRLKNKEEAAAEGRRTGAVGHIAFLAQDKAGEQFWSVAVVDAEGGNLKLSGAEIDLTLLEGQAADDARDRVVGARNKAKAQWQAAAV
ncbi:hypothetical protein ASF71_00735 [Deinococcus sp. Leaf326]|nr:hypothetical protein ASF71_00735 [Deinococcus sp. Leaf326]